MLPMAAVIPPPLPPPNSTNLRRRNLFISALITPPFLLHLHLVPNSQASLFRMPPTRLTNKYFLVRSGQSKYENSGVLNTNPVTKTSVDSGLSELGRIQTVKSALELRKMGACDGSCWIWPSITQRSYQAAEIIAEVNGVNRSRIVPEYSFLDSRGLGAYEGNNLDSIREVYAMDNISANTKPPKTNDGTPNESVADVFVRITQLMSIVETQYSQDTVIIISPDSDNLSILQAGLLGLDLRRHGDLIFAPGEVRFFDEKNVITDYKQPESSMFKCVNPLPSCIFTQTYGTVYNHLSHSKHFHTGAS